MTVVEVSTLILAGISTLAVPPASWIMSRLEKRLHELQAEATRAREAEHRLEMRMVQAEGKIHEYRNGQVKIFDEMAQMREHIDKRFDVLMGRIDRLLQRGRHGNDEVE